MNSESAVSNISKESSVNFRKDTLLSSNEEAPALYEPEFIQKVEP
jgi:hypothetical protein